MFEELDELAGPAREDSLAVVEVCGDKIPWLSPICVAQCGNRFREGNEAEREPKEDKTARNDEGDEIHGAPAAESAGFGAAAELREREGVHDAHPARERPDGEGERGAEEDVHSGGEGECDEESDTRREGDEERGEEQGVSARCPDAPAARRLVVALWEDQLLAVIWKSDGAARKRREGEIGIRRGASCRWRAEKEVKLCLVKTAPVVQVSAHGGE